MQAANKKLNEMNRLSDMGHFPPLVNAGGHPQYPDDANPYLVPRPAPPGTLGPHRLDCPRSLPQSPPGSPAPPDPHPPRLPTAALARWISSTINTSSPTGSISPPPRTWRSGSCRPGPSSASPTPFRRSAPPSQWLPSRPSPLSSCASPANLLLPPGNRV